MSVSSYAPANLIQGLFFFFKDNGVAVHICASHRNWCPNEGWAHFITELSSPEQKAILLLC